LFAFTSFAARQLLLLEILAGPLAAVFGIDIFTSPKSGLGAEPLPAFFDNSAAVIVGIERVAEARRARSAVSGRSDGSFGAERL
jgi:hypothetical protein